MAKKLRIVFNILSVLYPVVVFFLLIVLKLPIRIFSLFILIFGLGYLGVSALKGKQDKKKSERRVVVFSSLLFLLMAGSFITNSSIFIRLYSFFVNMGMFFLFFSSLFLPEPIVYRFATLAQPSIRQSITREKVKAYCRKVTVLWCFFFIGNGSVAFYTAFYVPEKIWAIYNGLISYILMGALFTGEFIVRLIVQKGMEKEIPISQIRTNSRSKDCILCYEGSWNKKKYKTWEDFILETAKLRCFINQYPNKNWILHCEDAWLFLLAYTALLQCGRTVLLTANISPSFIQEIREEDTLFLADSEIQNAFSLEEIISNNWTGTKEELDFPPINPDKTNIILYTSGSTGHPKVVQQRLTEFEQDNKFILSQWGPELIKRKLCTTVSHHHIYGLLFSIMLPFTAGIPFRRTRISQPEEFLSLTDAAYTIIAVPAFLKRANELDLTNKLLNPWIFTSGGVLSPEEAKRTSDNFGFWPIEVYGSTETSGIAWRCSREGVEWTPFDNAEITLADNGCIKVCSPYIKSPDGFVTGDLAEILPNGRFILKGRFDSIVKIEEKRISTAEIENRLLQTELVQEVAVIPMESGHRQILAAVVVFNQAGKEKFKEWPKLDVNNYFKKHLANFFEPVVIPRKWRFPDCIPMDTQGKKSRQLLIKLFEKGSLYTLHKKEVRENLATIEFSVPASSSYFDGHFPNFPILPAVAQVTIALDLAKQCFNTSSAPLEVKKFKFSNMIFPEKEVKLTIEISEDGQNLRVRMEDPDNSNIIYSQGTIKMGEG